MRVRLVGRWVVVAAGLGLLIFGAWQAYVISNPPSVRAARAYEHLLSLQRRNEGLGAEAVLGRVTWFPTGDLNRATEWRVFETGRTWLYRILPRFSIRGVGGEAGSPAAARLYEGMLRYLPPSTVNGEAWQPDLVIVTRFTAGEGETRFYTRSTMPEGVRAVVWKYHGQ